MSAKVSAGCVKRGRDGRIENTTAGTPSPPAPRYCGRSIPGTPHHMQRNHTSTRTLHGRNKIQPLYRRKARARECRWRISRGEARRPGGGRATPVEARWSELRLALGFEIRWCTYSVTSRTQCRCVNLIVTVVPKHVKPHGRLQIVIACDRRRRDKPIDVPGKSSDLPAW